MPIVEVTPPTSEPDAASEANAANSPEFGFSPLAIIGTVKAIRADIALIKKFLVALAPVVKDLMDGIGKSSPAAAQFGAAAKELESTPEA